MKHLMCILAVVGLGMSASAQISMGPVEDGLLKRGYAVRAVIVNGTATVICDPDPVTRCVRVVMTPGMANTVEALGRDGNVVAKYEFQTGTWSDEGGRTTINFFNARQL